MPHKINCELTDEQLGLLCEVLAERYHKCYLRTLENKSCMLRFEEEEDPRGSTILYHTDLRAHQEFAICADLIKQIESGL